MLIDVPNGTTRLHMRLETPDRFSTQSIVMGSVADEELVEKAVIRAGDMAFKWRMGLTRPMIFNSRGRPMNMNAASPASVVTKKSARD